MTKTLLIGASLALSAAMSYAASYTQPFGAAGSLVIKYEVTSIQETGDLLVDSHGHNTFTNTVSGTVTNTTKLPIRCETIEPVAHAVAHYVSALALMKLTLRRINLDAGASQPFSLIDANSGSDVTWANISNWKVSCVTPLDYRFSSQTATENFAAGSIVGTLGSNQIGITVENNSDQPIEIVWNESSFTDTGRSPRRIFRSAVKYASRNEAQANTTIPPLAKVSDVAIPENVQFAEREWLKAPLFPSKLPPALAAEALTSMKGAKVALSLQLLVAGKKTPVTLVFEIAAVNPVKL
jgi:hypothetical protein